MNNAINHTGQRTEGDGMCDTLPEGHDAFRYYGPKQGAECACGVAFYPINGSVREQVIAHRFHVWEAEGFWVQMETYTRCSSRGEA